MLLFMTLAKLMSNIIRFRTAILVRPSMPACGWLAPEIRARAR